MKKVNISVCGKFHYTNYLKFIADSGQLNKFYYSHKLSTNSRMIGVERNKLQNLFLKEYLTVFHATVLRGYHFQEWVIRYQNLWQAQLLNRWESCDIYHTLNHGAAIKVCKLAKAKGSRVLGEPVNSSPENMFELIGYEHERLKIPFQKKMPDTLLRMIEEEQYFDYYLSPSSFVTESYKRKGVSENRIFTIPFGVDVNKFSIRNIKKEKFRVIYVAQITPRKAHLDLLEAWKLLNFSPADAELVFVGRIDPVMQPTLKKYEHLFTYAGSLTQDKLVDYYNSSTVFVMPSVEEGCSYAPLEAMACGLPVILTENTGTSELVTPGKEGFIVPIRSPEKIAFYLELLFNDPHKRGEMSRDARLKSEGKFGWDLYASELTNVYDKIFESA